MDLEKVCKYCVNVTWLCYNLQRNELAINNPLNDIIGWAGLWPYFELLCVKLHVGGHDLAISAFSQVQIFFKVAVKIGWKGKQFCNYFDSINFIFKAAVNCQTRKFHSKCDKVVGWCLNINYENVDATCFKCPVTDFEHL